MTSPVTVAGEEIVGAETSDLSQGSMEDILMASSDANCAAAAATDMSEHAYSSMSKSQQPG